jgi:hypothetical protein
VAFHPLHSAVPILLEPLFQSTLLLLQSLGTGKSTGVKTQSQGFVSNEFGTLLGIHSRDDFYPK